MKKRAKKAIKRDFESERQSRLALLSKLMNRINDESLNMTSCELRMYLLDIIDI